MKNNYLVSLLITTYNRKTLLEKLLECLINQSYTNLEILIADNHSEDGTEEMCHEYMQNDSRIQYFRHDENVGMTNNTNFIFKKATGDYISLICDDDWIDLDYVEKCMKFAEKHPDYTAILPRTKLYDEKYNLIRKCKLMNLEQEKMEDRICSYIENNLLCLMATGLFKKEFISELLKLEDVTFHDRYAEDWIYVLKALAIGKCKVLSTTNYNKLNNGYTSSFQASAEIWDTSELSNDNYWGLLQSKISEAIVQDKFFKLYADENKLKTLSKMAQNAVIKAEKKIYNPNRLSLEYLWRHPLFFLKPKFYKMLTNQFIK